MYNPIPAVLYLVGMAFLVNAENNTTALVIGFLFITALFIYTLNYMAKVD